MMTRVVTTCVMVAVMTLALAAQQKPKPKPSAEAKPQPAPPSAEVKRRNVNIEVAIADQTGSADPVKKVVTMIVADREMGSVRSNASMMDTSDGPVATTERRNVTLNVDARPVVHPDDSILLSLTLEYLPRDEEGEKNGGGRAQLNERMAVTLESGKTMMVSRAADPAGNRKITVELTATVMK
jgi:hypothetical protein